MGGKGGGISHDVQQGMLQNESALVDIAKEQNKNAQTLFGLTEPGLQTAESFYQSLATGDPGAISRAISPAAQQVTKASDSAKKNIIQNTPEGGEKNLALEMTEANKGSTIGSLGANAYLGAPNALANLAGQGIQESIASAGTGISSLSAGSQTLGSLGGLQLQGQQIQAENKGSTMGFLGSLAGAGATLGAAFV